MREVELQLVNWLSELLPSFLHSYWQQRNAATEVPQLQDQQRLSQDAGRLDSLWLNASPSTATEAGNKLVFMNHHRHYDEYDENLDDGQWAMEVIDKILERAFRQPPKFSSLARYLNHQYILLEDAGNAPENVKDDCFPGNIEPRHTFSLEGTISASKKYPPKGWSYWDSTLEKQRQLYIMTDSLNKRLNEQYWNQGKVVPVFRDERLKTKSYPKFVRDDISQQEMYISFNQEIV